jgi:hypothetical protein
VKILELFLYRLPAELLTQVGEGQEVATEIDDAAVLRTALGNGCYVGHRHNLTHRCRRYCELLFADFDDNPQRLTRAAG